MKQILVDMDGVLADVYPHIIQYEQRRTGQLLNIEDLQGKTEDEAFPDFRLSVNSKGFFRTAPLMKTVRKDLDTLMINIKFLLYPQLQNFR